MTDRQLEQKFRTQALTVISHDRTEQLVALCWQLAELDSFEDMVRAIRPR
jgi:hypothetical protein